MWRYPVLFSLALAVVAASPALAQPPQTKDAIKKIEAELEKLQAQLKETEARLDRVRALAAGKGDETRPFPRFGERGKGFGGFDPEKMKQMGKKFEGGRKEMAKKPDGKKGDAKSLPSMRKGFSGGFGGGFGGRGPDRPMDDRRASEIDRRLERIAQEIEELRRELKRK